MFALLLAVPTLAAAEQTPHPQPTINADALNARLRGAAAPTLPPRMHVPQQPTSALETQFIVETNAKGQVTRVRSGKSSPNSKFNVMTYGNALQTFIRKADGSAVAGTFRLIYDYSPATHMVERHVVLVREGGVNPNAIGAVQEMMEATHKHHAQTPKSLPTHHPAANH